MFFSLFLRVEFLYKPYAADPNENAVKLHNFNRLAKQLSKKVEKYAFPKMRKLFLWQIVSGCSPLTLADAEAAIGKLKVRKDCPNDADLESLSDKELMPILKAIRDTQIDKLRNKVVHKQAYRPTWEEVESALDECRKLLPPLTWHLGLHDDPGWYVGENLAGR